MRRTSRPKAVRAVEKTLLIDGLQYHGHGSLEHFILEGGNADGSRLRTIAFRDVHPANWWRHVAAGMSAFKQRAEVALQIARVLLGHLPVHAGGAVLARASIRLVQPVDVDVMGERCQCRLRHLARQFRYPLEFR